MLRWHLNSQRCLKSLGKCSGGIVGDTGNDDEAQAALEFELTRRSLPKPTAEEQRILLSNRSIKQRLKPFSIKTPIFQ